MAGKRSHASAYASSDVFHKFVCDPCARDNQNMKAVKFCWDCGDNLCAVCVQLHMRFSGMKIHQISACGNKTSCLEYPFLPKLTRKCKEHDRMLLDTFCVDHNVVCCGTCVSIDHRLCKEIQYLPDAAAGISDTKKYQDTINRLETTIEHLEFVTIERQKDRKRLDKDRSAIIKQLKACRDKYNKLEQKVLASMHKVHAERCKTIDADTRVSESNIYGLRQLMTKLDNTDKRDEPNLFLLSREADESLLRMDKLTNKYLKRLGTETIKFKPDLKFDLMESLGTCEGTRHSFAGSVKNQKTILSPPVVESHAISEATPVAQFDIRTDDVDKHPEIFGVANLPDGTFVVGDYSNSCLRMLNSAYKIVGMISLPSSPYSVCCTGPTEVCTTLVHLKSVQFVKLRPSPVLSASFETEMPCRGIANLAGNLYVTCGGAFGEDHGQIHEYTTDGQLVRVIDGDKTGTRILSWPVDICVDKDSDLIYVADREKGVVAIGASTGKRLWTFTDVKLKYARGVCVDMDGYVYVSGRNSRNVVQISPTGDKMRVILSGKDGLSEPCVLCFEAAKRRLLLTSYTHCMVKVFDLH